MRHLNFSWQGVVALLLCLLALTSLPLLAEGAAQPLTDGMASLVFIIVIAAALLSFAPQPPAYRATVLFIGAHGAAWMLLSALSGNEGMATRAFFLLLFACWLLAWRCVTELSNQQPVTTFGKSAFELLIPAIFGAGFSSSGRRSRVAPASPSFCCRRRARSAHASWPRCRSLVTTSGRRSSRQC